MGDLESKFFSIYLYEKQSNRSCINFLVGRAGNAKQKRKTNKR